MIESEIIPFNVLFIDSHMPVMNGRDTLLYLKAQKLQITKILVSGDNELRQVINQDEDLADEILLKPVRTFQIKNLLEKIQETKVDEL